MRFLLESPFPSLISLVYCIHAVGIHPWDWLISTCLQVNAHQVRRNVNIVNTEIIQSTFSNGKFWWKWKIRQGFECRKLSVSVSSDALLYGESCSFLRDVIVISKTRSDFGSSIFLSRSSATRSCLRWQRTKTKHHISVSIFVFIIPSENANYCFSFLIFTFANPPTINGFELKKSTSKGRIFRPIALNNTETD